MSERSAYGVQLDIVGQDVRKVLIDNGSSVDIIFRHTLRRMILGGQKESQNAADIQGPLYGFGNNPVPIQGTIDLPTTFGTSPQEVTALVNYYIIDIASSYNVIIGRPTLFFFGAIISAPHMKVKFPTAMGPGSLVSDIQASKMCYSASISLAQTNPRKRKLYGEQKQKVESGSASKAAKSGETQIFIIENPDGGYPEAAEKAKPSKIPRALPGEPVEQVELFEGDPSRLMAIGSNLGEPLRGELVRLLREYADIYLLGILRICLV